MSWMENRLRFMRARAWSSSGGDRGARRIELFILLAHLALTIPLAALLNIWIDEAYSLHTTGQGVRYAMDQAALFEVQPPLYFVLLTLWRRVSGTLFWARLFSVACAAATVVVVGQMARRWFPTRHPAWWIASVALHPVLLWAAVEARVYALVILFSALSLLWFFDGYRPEAPSRGARWKYWFVVVAGLYTHYYLGFLFAAQAGVLVARRQWRSAPHYVMAGVGAGLCVLPLFWLVSAQTTMHDYLLQGDLSLLAALEFLYHRVNDFALPTDWPLLVGVRNVLLPGVVLIAVGYFWRNPRSLSTPHLCALWIIVGVLTLCFVGVAAHLGWKELMGRRHTATLFLPVQLAVLALMAATPKKALLPAWGCLLLCFNATALAYEYRKLAKLGDWDRVAHAVMGAEQPGQTVAVFPGEWLLPFTYHYQGVNAVAPLPRGETFQSYDLRKFALHDERDLIEAFTTQGRDTATVWLVTFESEPCETLGVHFGCDILEAFVNTYYTTETELKFFSSRVRLLRRKADTPFPPLNRTTQDWHTRLSP
jgi:hypothetical protein